jgi:hypothetical protein
MLPPLKELNQRNQHRFLYNPSSVNMMILSRKPQPRSFHPPNIALVGLAGDNPHYFPHPD